MDKIDFMKLFFYGKFIKKIHKNAFISKKKLNRKNSGAKCYLFVFLLMVCKFYQNWSVKVNRIRAGTPHFEEVFLVNLSG